MGVGLYRLLAGEHLLGETVHLSVHGGALRQKRARLTGDVARVEDGQRDCHQYRKHQRRADGEHHDKGSDHRDDAGQNLDHVGGEGVADDVDVIGDAADDVAGLVGVEVAHRGAHQFVEDFLAELLAHGAADLHHQHGEDEGAHGGGDVDDEHEPCVVGDGGKVDLSLALVHRLDGVAGQLRARQG